MHSKPGPQDHKVASVCAKENNQDVGIILVDIVGECLVDFLDEGAVVVGFLADHDEHVALLMAVLDFDMHRDARLHYVILLID